MVIRKAKEMRHDPAVAIFAVNRNRQTMTPTSIRHDDNQRIKSSFAEDAVVQYMGCGSLM
jgi:hypothetical protein